MPDQRLQYLFNLYIQRSCTPAEKRELYALALAMQHDADIQELLDKYWEEQVSEFRMPEERSEGILKSILGNEIKVVPRVHRIHFRRSRWWAAAAIIIMLATGSYFMFFDKKTNNQDKIVNNLPTDVEAPKGTKATITLADGRVISIDSLSTIDQANIKVTKTQDGQIVYAGLGNEVVFNTLSNPRGSKVIDLVLNDGSHVWLNAGSSLTYPVAFIGKDRKVSITGEAYFEVTKDSRPFTVSKGDMKVEVLGTHFNVNAYDDESDIKITLLEGSVNVLPRASARGTVIKPGQQAKVANSQLSIVNNIDVEAVMAWKNGLFSFNRADLPTVMRQLSRHYDVEVQYEGKIPALEFGGKMQRDLNLSQVLRLLEKNEVHFRIEGRKIIVMQ